MYNLIEYIRQGYNILNILERHLKTFWVLHICLVSRFLVVAPRLWFVEVCLLWSMHITKSLISKYASTLIINC